MQAGLGGPVGKPSQINDKRDAKKLSAFLNLINTDIAGGVFKYNPF